MTNGDTGAQEPLLLGIRHHGPGSARAVRAALEQFKPDVVLVEGPPEADAILPLAADEGMRPPVALLGHAVDAVSSPSGRQDGPSRAAFWPFAEFSPEWVAIRHAVDRGVPARFIDLPAAHTFALKEAEARAEEEAGAGEEEKKEGSTEDGKDGPADIRVDPIGVLAGAAGYDDAERWWEDAVELASSSGGRPGAGPDADGSPVAGRGADALAPFAALAEAMGALREEFGHGGHRNDPVREAHMRLRIRDAQKEFGRVAVVCGAWHVPALAEKTPVTADRRMLKGLPRTRVEVTWVPWTHRRLGRESGYGAGIASPGWYHHLFSSPDRPVARWMTKVAGLLREEDHPVSSAHVIEAVRLAESLAVMRGRPLAGLTEAADAVRAVMCEGSDVPLALVHDRLVVGTELGEVPDSAPAVPLQRDLTRAQRSLRLKPEALEREVELDLRRDTDAARSRLLHRLRLLGIDWGEPVKGRGSTGTFRETWRLRWEPESAVRVAEAGVWGVTVVSAASARAEDCAVNAPGLADVTALAEKCLLADVPDALPAVMKVLADRAALDADVGHLAQALPALVRSVRYGDVRGTDSAALREVAEGLAVRVCVGLPPACPGLDADGARQMRAHLDAAHQAMALLDSEDTAERWTGTLSRLAREQTVGTTPGVPGLLRGRAARLLLDDGTMDTGEAARLMALALSPGTAPGEAAAWVEGFLAGGGMLLVHDDRLLALVDAWLTGVSTEAFTDVLPLLRRTFSEFESGVRRTVGELVRRGDAPAGTGAGQGGDTVPDGFAPVLDSARGDIVLPTLRLLLGLGLGTADPASRAGTAPDADDPGTAPDGTGPGGASDGARGTTSGITPGTDPGPAVPSGSGPGRPHDHAVSARGGDQ